MKPAQILAICLFAFPLVGTVSKSVPPHRAMSLRLTEERVARRARLDARKQAGVDLILQSHYIQAEALFEELETALLMSDAGVEATEYLLGELRRRVKSDRIETAEGVKGHVGLTADAPIAAVQAFTDKFQKRYKYVPDHNGIKGYTAVYAVKYATEKQGNFDRKALAKSLHGMTITPAQEPGILIETTWDARGDIDRISFLVEVVDGKQKVVEILPKLGK